MARQRGHPAESCRESHLTVPWEALLCSCAHCAVTRMPALPTAHAHPKDPTGCQQTVSEALASPDLTFWGSSVDWGYG